MADLPLENITTLEDCIHLDIHQLENTLNDAQKTPDAQLAVRVIRQALRQRQRYIKAQAMEFEQDNHTHLLLFDSTHSFSKLAGNSVVFYTMDIANKINRRCNVKNDTDNYSPSLDGIVSIRSLHQLEPQLAEINILPDHERSTTELHFYKFPHPYTDAQIEKFRNHSHHTVEDLASIIAPNAPLPELYERILEVNRQIYHQCKHVTDEIIRDIIVRPLLTDANELVAGYLNYANARPDRGIVQPRFRDLLANTYVVGESRNAQAQNLLGLVLCARNIRNNVANLENLHFIHHNNTCSILNTLILIERIATREYNKIQCDN